MARVKLVNQIRRVLLIITSATAVTEVVMFAFNQSHATPYYLAALFGLCVILSATV